MVTSKKALIVTAIPLEYQAVRDHLNEIKTVHSHRNVPYEIGKFLGLYCEWSVGLVQLVEPGNEESALVTQEAMNDFGPELMLFVGIAGGIKDVMLGDVVVGTKVYGYEYGVAKRNFETRPDLGRSDELLLRLASFYGKSDGWLQRVGTTPPPSNKVYVAPIAAGSAVVKSHQAAIVRLLKTHYSDALAVEMEGRGFLRAAWRDSQVKALVVRGISDLLGNKQKADKAGWQATAAKHAAAFSFEVLANYVVSSAGFNKPPSSPQPTHSTTQKLDAKTAIKHLLGHDPLRGNEAIQQISQIGNAALPELISALMNCGVNEYLDLQPLMRLPKAFGVIGEASVPALIKVIREGQWAAQTTASRCFRFFPDSAAANELAKGVKTWDDPDSVRCAIEALGWLNSSGWSYVIEDTTFEGGEYYFEKYWFYALTAFWLMLAFDDKEWSVGFSVSRIERFVAKTRETGGWNKDSYWIAIKDIADEFLPLGTAGLRSWLTSEDELLHGAAGYVVQRRRPPYAVKHLLSYAMRGNSMELKEPSIFAIGEIGTKKACEAVLELLAEKAIARQIQVAGVHAISKMYHHLSAVEQREYDKHLSLQPRSLVNAWYLRPECMQDTKRIQEFLDSEDEWLRRPAAVCLGLKQGPAAQSTLRRYLRHSSTPMDKAFILLGLVRSGALEFCEALYTTLGEARGTHNLDYIWKREFATAISIDPNDGPSKGNAWAEVLHIDFAECAEEIKEIRSA